MFAIPTRKYNALVKSLYTYTYHYRKINSKPIHKKKNLFQKVYDRSAESWVLIFDKSSTPTPDVDTLRYKVCSVYSINLSVCMYIPGNGLLVDDDPHRLLVNLAWTAADICIA